MTKGTEGALAPGWVALLLAVFLAQGVHGLAASSGTCDELGAHLPAGILYWMTGEFSGGIANPPLGQLLVAAGAVVAGTWDEPLRDDPAHLAPARIPVLALGVVTLLATASFGSALAGRAAGTAALGAAALCPNLVAHSRLATLDLPVTAFFALATLAAWRWTRAPSLFGLVAFGALSAAPSTAARRRRGSGARPRSSRPGSSARPSSRASPTAAARRPWPARSWRSSRTAGRATSRTSSASAGSADSSSTIRSRSR
jgi:hypothetical protein